MSGHCPEMSSGQWEKSLARGAWVWQFDAEQYVVGEFLHGEPVLMGTCSDELALFGGEAQEDLSASSAAPMRVRCCHGGNPSTGDTRSLASHGSRRVGARRLAPCSAVLP